MQNINNKIFKANAINVNSLKSSNENIKNTIVSSIVKQCEHVGKKVTVNVKYLVGKEEQNLEIYTWILSN